METEFIAPSLAQNRSNPALTTPADSRQPHSGANRVGNGAKRRFLRARAPKTAWGSGLNLKFGKMERRVCGPEPKIGDREPAKKDT